MVLSRILAVVFVLFSNAVYAQVNRYMVFFTDKEGSPYTVSQPEEFLSERAMERRIRQGIMVTEQDFPVNPSYVSTLKDEGVEILYSSRWMNGVLIQCSPAQLTTVESLPIVQATELAAPGARPSASGRRKTVNRKLENGASPATVTQHSMIGLDEMHKAGYRGEDIIIAVFDAGFPGVNAAEPFQHLFEENRINTDVSFDFVYKDQDVFRHHSHGTEVLSVIGAYWPDTYTGGAYKAQYQLYVTEDVATEYRVEEYNWLFAAERADSAGVDIINSSLGYNTFDLPSMNYSIADLDGVTAVISKAAELAANRGIVVVTSAGNEGNNSWQFITAPADNQHVFAIGSVSSSGAKSPTSSIGPTADDRIKPDVAALGVGVSVVKPAGNISTTGGTSFAAPLVTSLVAGSWQRYRNMTNSELLEAVRSAASQANSPDNLLGYGIPNFQAIVNKIEWLPQEKLIEIFPNPVVDTLTIRPRSPVEVDYCLVEVITLQGQTLATREVNFNWLNRLYETDLSHLPTGIYFLRIQIGQQIFSHKLVKI